MKEEDSLTKISMLLLVAAFMALIFGCFDRDDDDSAATPPGATKSPGAQFRGAASIDGDALPDRSIIVAQIDGTNCGSGFVTEGSYELTVESTDINGLCGTLGDAVTFVLGVTGGAGGTEAEQSGTWDNTRVNALDLSFTTP